LRRLLTLLVVAGVALSGCGSVQADAARVGGESISRASFNAELRDIAANKGYVQAFDQQQGAPAIEGAAPGTFNQAFVAYQLTRAIDYAVVHGELARRNALPDSAAVDLARTEVTQQYTDSQNPTQGSLLTGFPAGYQRVLVERRAELDALQASYTKTDITPQAVSQYYNDNQVQFVTELCVRHILLAVKDAAGNVDAPASKTKADQVKAQLDQGADFAQLAKADSQDNQGTGGGSAGKGGQLTGSAADGCLTSQDAQSLVAPFAQAMIALPVNQVSPPVQTQFGYHLIEVTSRTVAPLDQSVTQAIDQQLTQTFVGKLIQQAGTKIKVDPQFGHYDATANPPTVVPPPGPQLPASTGQVPSATTLPGSTTTGG
jgi:citrate lyase gamma subunit